MHHYSTRSLAAAPGQKPNTMATAYTSSAPPLRRQQEEAEDGASTQASSITIDEGVDEEDAEGGREHCECGLAVSSPDRFYAGCTCGYAGS